MLIRCKQEEIKPVVTSFNIHRAAGAVKTGKQKMEQEKEFYIKKICAALEGATLAEVLTIYAAVAAYIRPAPERE